MRDVTLGQMNGTPLTAEQVDGLLQREMDLASAADCVLAVSETDGKTFLKHGIETVGIVGFSIQAAPTPQSFSGRNGFLFVGAIHEEASPNGDSIIWFLEKILPKIHAELGSPHSRCVGRRSAHSRNGNYVDAIARGPTGTPAC